MKFLVKKYFAETKIAYLMEVKEGSKLFTHTNAREIRVKCFDDMVEDTIIEEDIKILDTFEETTKKVKKDGKLKTYTNRLYNWE